MPPPHVSLEVRKGVRGDGVTTKAKLEAMGVTGGGGQPLVEDGVWERQQGVFL